MPHVQHALPLPQRFENQTLARPEIARNRQPLVPVEDKGRGERGEGETGETGDGAAAGGTQLVSSLLSSSPFPRLPSLPSPLSTATTAAASARGTPASNMLTSRTNSS